MTDPCVAVNGAGIEYREFTCVYPALESFYFRYVDVMIGIVCCSQQSALHWNRDVLDCVNIGSFLIAILLFRLFTF